MSTLWACLNNSTHNWYYSLHVSLYHLEIIMGKNKTETLEKHFVNFCSGYDSAAWPYYVLQQVTLSISS